jgi:hypothetical protein
VTIDGVTLGLVVLALLPWLAPLIKSIEIPGIGKIELQEIKQQVEELRGQAASASYKADAALASHIVPTETAGSPQLAPDEKLLQLASEYDAIRATQKTGSIRTAGMTDKVMAMIQLARGIDISHVPTWLMDKKGGTRLLAYARLYAQPEPDLLSELVNTLTNNEDTRFGQYWAIQAIKRGVQSPQGRLDPEAKSRLVRFLVSLPKDSERYYELLKVIGVPSRSG